MDYNINISGLRDITKSQDETLKYDLIEIAKQFVLALRIEDLQKRFDIIQSLYKDVDKVLTGLNVEIEMCSRGVHKCSLSDINIEYWLSSKCYEDCEEKARVYLQKNLNSIMCEKKYDNYAQAYINAEVYITKSFYASLLSYVISNELAPLYEIVKKMSDSQVQPLVKTSSKRKGKRFIDLISSTEDKGGLLANLHKCIDTKSGVDAVAYLYTAYRNGILTSMPTYSIVIAEFPKIGSKRAYDNGCNNLRNNKTKANYNDDAMLKEIKQ